MEKLYTSTTAKLLHNLHRLIEIKNGVFRPISVQFAPTDKCNLDCDFCSVKNREGDEIEIGDAKKAVFDFKNLGAKTIEFTGGGEPTLYKGINELILYSHNLMYRIGFITNGIKLSKIVDENLDRLDWLRISLNSLDYVKDIDVPKIKGTLGFSYVINDRTTEKTFEKIKQYKEKYEATYVRIVPNCLSVDTIEESRKKAENLLNQSKGFFFQSKKYDVPKRCWIGYLKPFIAPDGYVYACSANPLIARKFDPRFRIGHISNVREIYDRKVFIPFDTSVCQKGKCFFKEHNDLIEDLLCEIEHEDFI
jgi:MoaA/NifB/PqqE/SkfB family radical SAM enzyme